MAQGKVTAAVLPYIPLMHGGSEVAIIAQWLQLTSAEPDARRRAEYGGLALVMAEAAGCWDVWKQGLKGWNMKASQQVLEWQAEARDEGRVEGRIEGRAETLLEVLVAKFGPLPADLIGAIRATSDTNLLRQWLLLVVQVTSLADFRQQSQL